MANLEHLEILNQGVAYWNSWRKENQSIRPDLSNLYSALLAQNYELDDPFDKYMNDLNLRAANLCFVEFADICMARSDFAFADLSGSILQRLNLNYSLFYGAKLVSAYLGHSTIACSDFTGAHMGDMHLMGLDLSAAIGLDSICHLTPSLIDSQTIAATAFGLMRLAFPDEQRDSIERFLQSSGNADLIRTLNEELNR